MAEYNQFIFSGTLFHSNIFRLGLKRAFFGEWFAQNDFLTELTLAKSGVHFSFTIIFQYIKFVQFCSNLSFPVNVVYNGENRLLISFFISEK